MPKKRIEGKVVRSPPATSLAIALLAAALLVAPAHGAEEISAAASETGRQGSGAEPASGFEEARRLIQEGRFAEAEDLCRKSLSEKEDGPDSALAVPVLNELILSLDRASGPREPAKVDLLQSTVRLKEGILGAGDPEMIRSYELLLHWLRQSGRYEEARELAERLLAIQEKALGPDDPKVLDALARLMGTLYWTGDLTALRRVAERMLANRERVYGPDHPKVARSLGSMAFAVGSLGDYEAMWPYLQRALAINEKSLGPDHPEVGFNLLGLGFVLMQRGDYEAARPLHERGLGILERAYGKEHPHYLAMQRRLPDLLWRMGEYEEARALYESHMAVMERKEGPSHLDVALDLEALAEMLSDQGDLEAALPLYERALPILVRRFGPDHFQVGFAMGHFALARAASGDRQAALVGALRAEAISRNHLRLTFAGLSEREALRLAEVWPKWLHLALALSLPSGEGPQAGGVLPEVWDSLVRSRALVLDELIDRRRSARRLQVPETAPLMEEFASTRTRLANLMVRGPGGLGPEDYRKRLDEVQEDQERAERALAERSAPFREEMERRRAGLEEVRAALPPESALVAYARYDHPLRGIERGRESRIPVAGVPGYLAFVLRSRDAEPVALRLGDAMEIDALVSAWKEEVSQGALNSLVPPAEAEGTYRQAGEALRRAVWNPLLPLLEGARTVFVVPDGALHLVSLATLPDGENGYLVERNLRIHYLSAERDLVGLDGTGPTGRGVLALGAPAFDETSLFAALAPEPPRPTDRKPLVPGTLLAVFRGERSSCGDFQSLEFSPLPQSAREVREVVSSWKKGRPRPGGGAGGAGADEMLLTGAEASEAAFKAQAPGREILHLATHGFFLGARCPSALGNAGSVTAAPGTPGVSPVLGENPLLLSGLALAGANHRDAAGPDEEDGILTAEEIAALDLYGTSWAVLSACNTGVGEIKTGEGVFGLQRALALAGADTAIMSLWRVDDRTARDWMRALYRARFADGRATVDAVREADLELLRRRRERGRSTHPYYWSGFVASGDWR